MESYSGGHTAYWKRMQYQRLDGGGGGGNSKRWRTRRRVNHRRRVELASGAGGGDTAGSKRRMFWRLKVAPRLGFLRRGVSPRRLLTRIRDAYVRMMLSLANSPVFGGGGGIARPALKEYNEKVIVEIYRSLVAQRHLIAASAARDGGGQTALDLSRRP